MSAFSHEDVRLAYRIFGPDDATPLLLLTGLGGAQGQWGPHAMDWARHWRLIMLDLRGHGESSHASASTYVVTIYAADVAAFLTAVIDQPVVLVGHSLGGVVAFEVARRHPELTRAVLLLDPTLFHHVPGAKGSLAGAFAQLRDLLRDARDRGDSVEEHAQTLRRFPMLAPGPREASPSDLRLTAAEQLELVVCLSIG